MIVSCPTFPATKKGPSPLNSADSLIKCLLLLLTSCLLASCAGRTALDTFDKPIELKEGTSVVYLYRTDLHSLRSAYPFVYLNGELEGKLEHQAYRVWQLEPGLYEWNIKAGDIWDEMLSADSWDIREKTIELDVRAGRYYFLRLKPSAQASILGWRDARLELVDQAKATNEMKKGALSAYESIPL